VWWSGACVRCVSGGVNVGVCVIEISRKDSSFVFPPTVANFNTVKISLHHAASQSWLQTHKILYLKHINIQ
jgi:hypothetical protein